MSIERTYGNWRADLKKQAEVGEQLEKVAKMHRDIPFECRVHWTPGCLDWVEFDGTLVSFSDRVKKVAARFGSADSVKGEHLFGSYDDRAPDLVAKWKLDDLEIRVRTFSPKDCKIDPRTKFQALEETSIHPECAAVLKELEDVDG